MTDEKMLEILDEMAAEEVINCERERKRTEKYDALSKAYNLLISQTKNNKERLVIKDVYVIASLENDWQKVIKLTEEQAKAIEWFIDEADISCYIQKASEVSEEIK